MEYQKSIIFFRFSLLNLLRVEHYIKVKHFLKYIFFFIIISIDRHTAAILVNRIGRLENTVDECIERIIDEQNSLQIDAICLLIKAYANNKGLNIKCDFKKCLDH